jgi:hypothetical protein
MINVVLIDPDGQEYDATLDDTGTDLELRQDIITALELDGTVDDYDVRLLSGIKVTEGSRIRIERKRRSKVMLQPKVVVRRGS